MISAWYLNPSGYLGTSAKKSNCCFAIARQRPPRSLFSARRFDESERAKSVRQESSYDAIVIGSGISGGWAAKELCEKGLKTLVLERGRNVVHVKDYPTMNMQPWEFEHRLQIPEAIREANPVVSKCYNFREDAMQ